MEATRTHYADGNTQGRARRGLTIFFAIVVALSAPIQAVIIAADLDGGDDDRLDRAESATTTAKNMVSPRNARP